jgi:hypothetical protein
MATTTCFDDPQQILSSEVCVSSLSKDALGQTDLRSSNSRDCRDVRCLTLRTSAILRLALTSNAPCDDSLAQDLSGNLTIETFATAYAKDGLGRGVHAGDFVWTTAAGTVLQGRMSGITNAGLVRAKPFAPNIEKCISEGILVGRLCGQVTKTQSSKLKEARVVATYRLQTTAAAKGENGKVVGTVEGVVITLC